MKKKRGDVTISVVVPYYNAEQTLNSCLEAIEAQTVKPSEVILVDNKSEDSSLKIVKNHLSKERKLYKICWEEKKGPSSARNRGFKESKGDVIVFTDGDCIADTRWIERISEKFEDPDVNAVAGKIMGIKGKSLFDKFHSLFTLKSPEKIVKVKEFTLVKGGFPAANLALRKDVLDAIGGFDESFQFFGEDYDLCARIYASGFQIIYLPDAIVYHKHRNNLKATWKQSFGFGTGHPKLLKKHFKRLTIIDFPKFQFLTQKLPLRLWFDFAGADKKLLLLIILSIIWQPATFLIPLYLIFLFFKICSYLQRNGLNARFTEKWQLIFLLFFKSVALTLGRIRGSIQNCVFCI